MRVLILATDIYTRGGIARYTAALATALGQLLGAENVDLLPLLDGVGRRFVPAEYRILAATTAGLTLGAKVRHAGRALRRARSGYDLVICSHVSQAPVAALIQLRHRTPYLVACHGSEAWGSLPVVKRAALCRANLALAVSAHTARVLCRSNGVSQTRVRILHNAIPEGLVRRLADLGVDGAPDSEDGVRPQPGGKRGPVLLSVGSLSAAHAYKGVDTMIEALPEILQAAPEVRYVVVGDGDHRPSLERLAIRQGVAGRVTFTGEVTDAELAAHYRACDVFVLPSRAGQRHGRWDGEGFGRVYVEAALAAKPVVGSRDGGAAEAVLDGQTGLLVDPRSAREVAGAVITLLRSPERAAAMGAAGRRWALENFTVDSMRSSLEAILRSL